MELAAKVKPGMGHRIIAVLLILTAVALVFQIAIMLSLTDETILSLVRAAVKRDQSKKQDPRMVPLTDEEIDRRIQDKKKEILDKAREDMAGGQMIASKGGAALLLLLISGGLLLGRRSPTRLLAGIAAVFLAIASFKAMGSIRETLGTLGQVKGMIPTADIGVALLLPVAALCCLVTATRLLWTGRPAGEDRKANAA